MTSFGLFLGGGGLVGIAWEIGVMAGLRAATGWEPVTAAVTVGSSAGSVAGATVALGRDLDELVASQQRTSASSASPSSTSGSSRSGSRPPAPFSIDPKLMELLVPGPGSVSGSASVEERAAAMGPLAMASAGSGLGEEEYVESFRGMLGTDEWPAGDFRATTADCESGASVLWSKTDGIGLIRAVATSCAIPGYFPTVSFRGRRYMDGPRGGFYSGLVRDLALDAVVAISPMEGMAGPLGRDPELDALTVPIVRVAGGPTLAKDVTNLMNPAARAGAVTAGLADGHAAAATLSALL